MCKNKKEFDKLVIKRRKLLSIKGKIEDILSVVNSEMSSYIEAKGSVNPKNNSKVVYGDGYKAMLLTIVKQEPDKDKLKAILGDKYESILKDISYDSVRVY